MFRVTDFFRLPYWPSKFPVAKDDTVDHDYAEPALRVRTCGDIRSDSAPFRADPRDRDRGDARGWGIRVAHRVIRDPIVTIKPPGFAATGR